MLLFSISKYSAIPYKMSVGQISYSSEENGKETGHLVQI